MRYWPLTDIIRYPGLHHSHIWELMCIEHTPLSDGAMMAANHAAAHTRPVEAPMVTVYSVDTRTSRMYTRHPDPESFARLERVGFVDTGEAFFLTVETLH